MYPQTVLEQICKIQFVFPSSDCGHGVHTYCVRLMNYIAGKTIAETPVTQKDLYEVGKLAATVDKTLQTVSLKALPGDIPLVTFIEDLVWKKFLNINMHGVDSTFHP